MATVFQHRFSDLMEERISQHYLSKSGANKTLHFLHGNGFAVRTYSAMFEYFKQDCSLALQDAAGHGLSESKMGFIGWEGSAQRFKQGLEQLKQNLPENNWLGLGHSFGACLTLLMSVRDPHAFSQNILLDPAFYPPDVISQLSTANGTAENGHKSLLVRQTERRKKVWSSFADAMNGLREKGTFVGWDEQCLEDYVTYSTYADEAEQRHLCCPPWLEAAVFGSAPTSLWEQIPKLKVPTYILWGTDTLDMFKQAYRLAKEQNPNLRFIEVKGGHCFMMQYPEQTANLIKSLINEGWEGAKLSQHRNFVISCDV